MTDGRRVEYMALRDLIPAPRNAKRHSVDDIKASMLRFGVVDLVTIDERMGAIISGHGRTDALAALEVAGVDLADPEMERLASDVQVDADGTWRVPVTRGWSSRDDAEAAAAGVALNRLTEKGGWDEDELAAMLRELGDGSSLDGVGFTSDELDVLLGAVVTPQFDEVESTARLDRKVHLVCPRCGEAVDPATAEHVER